MAITFSDEQAMLLETALDFCQKRSPIETVRESLDAKEVNRELWDEITELGWLGINVPESYGGLGLQIDSVVPVVESMGRYLMSSPYSASILTTEMIAQTGSEAQKAIWLPALATGAIGTMALTEEDGSWLLEEVSASGGRNPRRLCSARLVSSRNMCCWMMYALLYVNSVPCRGGLSERSW